MKQHITEKQLAELNEKGKTRLRKRFETEHDFEVTNLGAGVCKNCGQLETRPIFPPKCLPLLSIGQMLEFLGDNFGLIHLLNTIYEDTNKLCNALWRATKEKLET